MREIVVLKTGRDYYDINNTERESITVGELIRELSQYDENAKVVYSNDNGYTYGFLSEYRVTSEMHETSEEIAERERKEREEEELAELRETYVEMATELCADLEKTDADIQFCADRLMEYAKENGVGWEAVERKCWEDSNEMFDYIYA